MDSRAAWAWSTSRAGEGREHMANGRGTMHIARKGRARVVAGLTACLVEHNRVQQLARRVNSADVQLHQPSHPTSPGVTSRPGA